MRSVLLILLVFTAVQINAQEMRVGLIRTLKLKTIELKVATGSYELYADTLEPINFSEGTISYTASGVKCNLIEGIHDTIYIRGLHEESTLSVRSTVPSSKRHTYQGDFEITKNENRINLVNLVSMNDYLSGVIESEGGGGRHVEYYKVQALMSRTYALKNLNRHKKEGFNVCDGVHCQAYHNMLRYTPAIREAVKSTTGQVILDKNGQMVTSYFSANCGGQTCDASFVWNESIPFLNSFKDTFCVHTRQATWAKTIEKQKWKSFIEKNYGVYEEDLGELFYNFTQEDRKAFYIHPSLGIPLRDLRMHFRLKSTYFNSSLEGNMVVLRGRGFGHGVGLCQEGAMNMAKSGFTYSQIARFYFDEVQIVDYFQNRFYQQSEGL